MADFRFTASLCKPRSTGSGATTDRRQFLWHSGGGIRGGVTYGASDGWSYQEADKPIYCYDVHATVLHLLGIDHRKLLFRHNGIDRRLTDVHGEIIHEIVV